MSQNVQEIEVKALTPSTPIPKLEVFRRRGPKPRSLSWVGLGISIALTACSPPVDEPAAHESAGEAVEPGLAIEAAELARAVRDEPGRGLIVETIQDPSAAHLAGLQIGDVLLSWERLPVLPANPEAASGSFDSLDDYYDVAFEQAPRGPVRLAGERDGEPLVVEVGWGDWGLTVRPALPADMLTSYLSGMAQIEAGDVDTGIAAWQHAARNGVSPEDRTRAYWLWMRIAEEWRHADQSYNERAAYLQAVAVAPDSVSNSLAWSLLAFNHQRAGAYDAAHAALDRVQEVLESLPSKLQTEFWRFRSQLYCSQGNCELAEALVPRRGKQILPQLESASRPTTIWSRERLTSCSNQSDASCGEAGGNRYPPLSAHGSYVYRPMALANDGATRDMLNSFRTALTPRWYPSTVREAEPVRLRKPSLMTEMLGDYIEANRYFQEQLYLHAIVVPRPFLENMVYLEIAEVSIWYGDSEYAERLFQRVLSSEEVDDFTHVTALVGLGIVSEHSDRSAKYYGQAAQALDALPESWAYPGQLSIHSETCKLFQGDLDQVAGCYQSILELSSRVSYGSWFIALARRGLGQVAIALHEWENAADYLASAVDSLSTMPGAELDIALAESDLATAYIGLGENVRAAEYSLKALGRIEAWGDTLGYHRSYVVEPGGGSYVVEPGGGRRHSFQKVYGIYRLAVDLALFLHRPEAAFHHLEQSRARRFLKLLADRDSVAHNGSDHNGSEEPWEDRWRLGRRIDQVQRQLAESGSAGAAEAVPDRLQTLRLEFRFATEHEVFRASLYQANVNPPKPLDAQAARRALDPGTAMVAFAVAETRTHVFVLAPDDPSVRVVTLELGAEAVRDRVEEWIGQVAEASHDNVLGTLDHAITLGRRLYQDLIEPIAEHIDDSERLLILPDGPLHAIPWGALVRPNPEEAEREWQYLIEWKPIHVALSATAYSQLLAERRPVDDIDSRPMQLASFGDPVYSDDEERVDFRVRSAMERGLFDGWSRLEHSGREVEQIAELFPPGSTRVFLRDQATEEMVEEVAGQARILHLATHGHLDEQSPIDSAIVLTLPEPSEDRHNGLLQVWEILERVRLDADLVVLSACGTATGREEFGEGLQSLTRAFHFAGARSVVASLWDVRDRSTAELMVRFYRHLRSGLTKDEALRQAQIELIRGPVTIEEDGRTREWDFSSPFYWAPFQLHGDWR